MPTTNLDEETIKLLEQMYDVALKVDEKRIVTYDIKRIDLELGPLNTNYTGTILLVNPTYDIVKEEGVIMHSLPLLFPTVFEPVGKKQDLSSVLLRKISTDFDKADLSFDFGKGKLETIHIPSMNACETLDTLIGKAVYLIAPLYLLFERGRKEVVKITRKHLGREITEEDAVKIAVQKELGPQIEKIKGLDSSMTVTKDKFKDDTFNVGEIRKVLEPYLI